MQFPSFLLPPNFLRLPFPEKKILHANEKTKLHIKGSLAIFNPEAKLLLFNSFMVKKHFNDK